MRPLRQVFSGTVIAVVLVSVSSAASPASAAGTKQDTVVATVPGARTPAVLDNKVLDLAAVGNRIVVSGSFTRIRNAAANGGAAFGRRSVFAFDPSTGAVDRTFSPVVNGTVNAVLPGPGSTVYLGGAFSAVNGTAVRNLAQVSLARGALTAFRPPALNGAVTDLALAGGRLYVGGVFTTVGGVTHGGLASLNPASGARDEYLGVDVSVNHNWPDRGTARAPVGVAKLDVAPDGTRLVAIGNFRTADGLTRDQLVMVRLQAGAAVVDPNWRTTRYEPACFSWAFDSYVRDLQFAPDGSWFAVSTTGGAFPGSLCDSVARWDATGGGQDVAPRWVSYSGGDTLLSVEVTGTAVYTGGHQRWMNNPFGSDSPGAGAVPRPGLAALDPRTGLPLAWNPGRNPRGVGAEALLATSTGLYVGMDTEYIGDRKYLRPRLAYFPLAGGTTLPPETLGALPGTVYLAGRATPVPGSVPPQGVDDVLTRYVDGADISPDAVAGRGELAWSTARGAFMAGGTTLYYGYPDGTGGYALYRRTLDATGFGVPTLLDPYDDPAWSNVQTGSGQTYRGSRPSFYDQLPTVGGMFYDDGRLYYTRTGSPALYSRPFSLDSGIVGAAETTVTGSGFADVSGMFRSGGDLYVARGTAGDLARLRFAGGIPAGPVTVVSGPGVDGRSWSTRALFLGPGGPPPG